MRERDIYDDAIMYVYHRRAGDCKASERCAEGHESAAFIAAIGVAILPGRKRDAALKAARAKMKGASNGS